MGSSARIWPGPHMNRKAPTLSGAFVLGKPATTLPAGTLKSLVVIGCRPFTDGDATQPTFKAPAMAVVVGV